MNDEVTNINDRLEEGDSRMDRLEKGIAEISADTKELLAIFRATQGFFKVSGWIGKAVLKLSAISAAVVGLYHLLKHFAEK